MLTRRIIPCLDVKDGRVVKGVRFEELRDAGDPVEQARAYGRAGADELCFLDISASLEARGTLVALVERVARELSIPFAVGGGVRTVEDAEALLRAGADKVSMNTAALADPGLLTAVARLTGSLGARGGRSRRGRDPAHLDRPRRHRRRVRAGADASDRSRGPGAGDRERRSGRAGTLRRGVRRGRLGRARRERVPFRKLFRRASEGGVRAARLPHALAAGGPAAAVIGGAALFMPRTL